MAQTLPAGAFGDDLDAVVEAVRMRPGLTRAAVAGQLGGRRATALGRVDRALQTGLVHRAASAVTIRAGGTRTVQGLFAGPGPDHMPAPLPGLEEEGNEGGPNLRAVRQEAGISSAVLADHLGVSRMQLHRWETGQQAMPPRHRLQQALQAAQATAQQRAEAGRAISDVRDLVAEVRRQPGRSRYALVRPSARRRAVLLDQALALGLVHIAPAWGQRTRQKLDGVYPGPRPQEEQPMVQVPDLREARQQAGWSQEVLAARLGVARTTVEAWEHRREHVPAWATVAATQALKDARQVAAERVGRPSRSDRILELVGQCPGLSEKALAKALGYERQDRIGDDVRQLEAQQVIHRRHAGQHGQQTGLYPGPAQADDALTPDELRALRTSRGLLQRQLAERYGTHVQAVRDWESSRRPMSLEHQQGLRELLEALEPVGTPPRLLQLRAQLAEEVELHQGRTRRQLDLVVATEQLGSRAEVDAALVELVADQIVHEGRIGAGVVGRGGRITSGRVGYLPGPA